MNNICIDECTYSSRDFYLSSCLLGLGKPLRALIKGSGGITTFVFNISPDEAKNILEKHWNRELLIPSKDLIEAIKELKTRLYSGE